MASSRPVSDGIFNEVQEAKALGGAVLALGPGPKDPIPQNPHQPSINPTFS